MVMVLVWLGLIGVALVTWGYAIRRTALWADDRGWFYYRTKPRFRSPNLGLPAEIHQPPVHHAVEERSADEFRVGVEETGEGDAGAGPS